jgi:hypothetical protein
VINTNFLEKSLIKNRRGQAAQRLVINTNFLRKSLIKNSIFGQAFFEKACSVTVSVKPFRKRVAAQRFRFIIS